MCLQLRLYNPNAEYTTVPCAICKENISTYKEKSTNSYKFKNIS